MTNAEKFEEVFGAEPSTAHCPILWSKDCGRCKGFEGNSPCCDSDWWNSEYKKEVTEKETKGGV